VGDGLWEVLRAGTGTNWMGARCQTREKTWSEKPKVRPTQQGNRKEGASRVELMADKKTKLENEN